MNIIIQLIYKLPAILCVISALIMAKNNIEGWGWFLFIALMMQDYNIQSLQDTEEKNITELPDE